jgi:Zn-dependent oligopeptidase
VSSSKTNIELSRDALAKFVNQVDEILRTLEASAGSPTKVSAQTIKRTSLASGGNTVFHEAQGLFNQYNRVHKELTNLSKTLHLQIEAMGIAVQGAAHGFDNLEEEQRQRFWAIQSRLSAMEDAKDGSKRTDGDRGGLKG